MGDLRATWGVLGEVLGGSKKGGTGSACGYFVKDGVGETDRAQIAEGFCEFYSQVGPKLLRRIRKERDGAFLEYMGYRVEGSLFWRPVTPKEVEELCGALVSHKGMGWDGVSPRVMKGVARQISIYLYVFSWCLTMNCYVLVLAFCINFFFFVSSPFHLSLITFVPYIITVIVILNIIKPRHNPQFWFC